MYNLDSTICDKCEGCLICLHSLVIPLRDFTKHTKTPRLYKSQCGEGNKRTNDETTCQRRTRMP